MTEKKATEKMTVKKYIYKPSEMEKIMHLKIVEANESDRDFILLANRQIDSVSNISKSALKDNIDADLIQNKLCTCLIAKYGKKRVGMMLFSKVYWADRGEGVYISQAFVDEKYRKKGVFKALLKASFNFYPNTKFVTLLVAKENLPMQKCVEKLNFEHENMFSYVVNLEDFE